MINNAVIQIKLALQQVVSLSVFSNNLRLALIYKYVVIRNLELDRRTHGEAKTLCMMEKVSDLLGMKRSSLCQEKATFSLLFLYPRTQQKSPMWYL